MLCTFNNKKMSARLVNIRLSKSEQSELHNLPRIAQNQAHYKIVCDNRKEKIMNMRSIETLMPRASDNWYDFLIVTCDSDCDENDNPLIVFACNYEFDDAAYQMKIWSPKANIARDGISGLSVKTMDIGLYFSCTLSMFRYGRLARLLMFNYDSDQKDSFIYGTPVKLHYRGKIAEVSRNHDIYEDFQDSDQEIGILICAHDMINVITNQEQLCRHNNLKNKRN